MDRLKYKIGLLVIATGKYLEFVPPLYQSAKRFFFTGHSVEFFLFTNHSSADYSLESKDVTRIGIKDEPWPYPTLKRYNYFTEHRDCFSDLDFLFYCDADMRFVAAVGEEILPNESERLVGVEHPGFCLMPRPKSKLDQMLKRCSLPYRTVCKRLRGTYEINPVSLACVAEGEGEIYYCGGFNGGRKDDFIKMSETINQNIEKDTSKGHIAIWHDESHLNRYFIDNPPKTLTPAYCYPESWVLPFEKRIVALDKDHDEMRSKTFKEE